MLVLQLLSTVICANNGKVAVMLPVLRFVFGIILRNYNLHILDID